MNTQVTDEEFKADVIRTIKQVAGKHGVPQKKLARPSKERPTPKEEKAIKELISNLCCWHPVWKVAKALAATVGFVNRYKSEVSKEDVVPHGVMKSTRYMEE